MAEIPVERKAGSSFPMWLIPLILLLLLLPLLYFCSRNNAADNTNNNVNRTNAVTPANANNRVAANSGTGMNSANSGNTAVVVDNNNAAANGGSGNRSVIKDVNEFGSATDKTALAGRGFFVNGVKVSKVLSDNVFTVKSGSSEMYVMLDQNLDSPGGKEGQIKIKPGQNVNLGGEFRSVPSGETSSETKGGGLNSKEYAQMKGQQVYLHATSVSDAK
jgi:hypothetical protein